MHIKELILETASLHRTRLFYHKTLELDILDETEEQISFRAGRTRLSFKETGEGKPFYHFAFNITNNRFSDAFEWLSQKLDLLSVSEDMLIAGYDDWNAQSFYFYDNGGNIVEFITRFDLPYYAAGARLPDCIEEVSEIGLVTGQTEELARVLRETYQIPYFKKGPRLHDFIAMGDEHGLLLVCQDKRGWVPTHKPARKFPVTVVDENDRVISIGPTEFA